MFWKKKSHDDILFEAAVKRVKIFVSLAQLQGMNVALYKMAGQFDDTNSNYRKAIIYLYYDTYAALHSQQLSGQQNDLIKAFLRDWALSSLEGIAEGQFRTYAADATSHQQLSAKIIHPVSLLNILHDKPVFDIILRNKVNEKINELADILSTYDSESESVRNHLVELLQDEELIKSFQAPVELSSISLKCGSCASQEKLEQINGREDSQICIFKTGELRAGDDLEIFSFYCFECQNITKFSFDTHDFSGNAENGVEYFGSYSVELNDVKNALLYLRDTGDFIPALRLISSFPAVVDEIKDL